MSRLKDFENGHLGEKAILVAGGPSLKYVSSGILNEHLTFSVSLTYKKEGFIPIYHFIGDKFIAKQFADELVELELNTLFVSRAIKKNLLKTKWNAVPYKGHFTPEFCKNPYKGVHGGGTSTFVAMQFAYFMGIQELYVVGLDHYATLDKTQAKVVGSHGSRPIMETDGIDVNHFTNEFYPKGTQWHYPQVERMAESYLMARKAFEADGRKIYNASKTTALSEDYLPRVDFEDIF
jgi:hypothetical protein